jgi:hypothetical protein
MQTRPKAMFTGMVHTRTELGSDTPESRYQRARLLFTQLAEAL